MIVQELTRNECFALVAGNDLGHLACARDNFPYVVPIHYVLERETLYMFSLDGMKIATLRSNPNACLQVEENVESRNWKSVIALGHYKELTGSTGERDYAWDLLQKRAGWWEPGAFRPAHLHSSSNAAPIYFSIVIDAISGRQAIDGL